MNFTNILDYATHVLANFPVETASSMGLLVSALYAIAAISIARTVFGGSR